MSHPRIGRSDTMAALLARRLSTPAPRLAASGPGGLQPPSSSLDDVAWRAHAIAANLSLLTRMTASVRGRLPRGDADRRARLDGLHDRALALWHELAGLAGEAAEQSVAGRRQ